MENNEAKIVEQVDADNKELLDKEYKELLKEGYVHLVARQDDKKVLLYIEKGLPLAKAFDSTLDFLLYLRNLHKKQIQDAIEANAKKENTEVGEDPSSSEG